MSIGNGNAPQPPQFQPGQLVQPGPMVTMVTAAISPDGQPYVHVRIEHSTGMSVFPMSPELAINFGKNLKSQGRAALSGLVIPAGAQLPEDDDDDEVAETIHVQSDPADVVENQEGSDG